MSGAGANLTSQFCTTVAHEDLAHSVSTFFTCYKDTSLIGVYTECPKETIPRLMEVTMQVRSYVSSRNSHCEMCEM